MNPFQIIMPDFTRPTFIYLWFISDVYPTIKDIFESLLGEHNPDLGDSIQLSNCLDPSTKKIPEKLPLTRTTQSHIPLSVTPTTPCKTYSSSIISPPKIDPNKLPMLSQKQLRLSKLLKSMIWKICSKIWTKIKEK